MRQMKQWFKSSVILGILVMSLWAIGIVPRAWAAPSPAAPESLQQLYRALDEIFNAAFSATQSGDFAAAEAQWSKAIELAPQNPAAWSNRGNAHLSQFQLEEALADFNQAVTLAPDLPDPYINRGIVWEALGDWNKAIADYDRAIDLNPKDAVAYNNRGNAKGGAGDWQGAAADFKTATELAPGLAAAGVNYALALYQVGEEKEATRLLKNMVRKYSQFADPRAALSAVLWDQGFKGEAESNWYPVMGLDPRYKDLDWLRTIRRWPPKAVEAIDRFLKL
ncbi:MAG: tetratricopeptide repeat protein [Prochlorotrichaceae cyanobacterium]